MRWCNILLERMKIERTVISKVIHVDYVKMLTHDATSNIIEKHATNSWDFSRFYYNNMRN